MRDEADSPHFLSSSMFLRIFGSAGLFDFEVHAAVILKDLADFPSARTARSGQKPGSRNEIGTAERAGRTREPGHVLVAIPCTSTTSGVRIDRSERYRRWPLQNPISHKAPSTC
jgi:hypothetical protein